MEVQPGTLSLTILGGGSNNSSAQLDSGLDSLFKNSAGPSSVATPPKPVQDVGELLKQAIKQKKAASQSKEQDSAKKTRKRKAKEVDDDDDDDEEGDKENDSDEEQQQRRAEAEKEKERRTVFVGNVPKECIEKKNQKALKRKFAEYGQIESMRFRSIAFSEPIHRKAAFINKKLHSDRHALNAYIVFKTKEAADNALAANGYVFMDRHLRVDNAAEPKPHDRKRSVFLGSLPLDVEEEELWEFFKDCGEIEGVRVVRDKATNLGKGIGYVEFKSRESVALALALDDKTFRDKGTIRVQKCKIPGQEKTKTKISPKQIVSGGSKSKLQQQRHQQTSSMKKNQKKNSKEAAATKTPKAFEGVRASKKVGELHNKKNKTKSSRKKQKRS